MSVLIVAWTGNEDSQSVLFNSPLIVIVELFKLDRFALFFGGAEGGCACSFVFQCPRAPPLPTASVMSKGFKECLLLPDTFVKRANNRRLSFPPPLSGEGPWPRGEWAGTKTQPLFYSSCQKSPGQASQSSFFLGNSAP